MAHTDKDMPYAVQVKDASRKAKRKHPRLMRERGLHTCPYGQKCCGDPKVVSARAREKRASSKQITLWLMEMSN